MLKDAKADRTLNKEKVAVLLAWFVLLVLVRIVLSSMLQHVWLGTLGAVTITFAIFYGMLRYTPFRKYSSRVDAVLLGWYRKKFFYVSGLASIFILASILFMIEYGYAKYSDKLVTLQVDQQQFARSLQFLASDQQLRDQLHKSLSSNSPIEVVAITLASTDATLHGYYSQIIGFILAENIEILAFLIIFRRRQSLFARAAPARASSKA